MVVALKEKNGGLSPALKENMYGEFKTRLVKPKRLKSRCRLIRIVNNHSWDGTVPPEIFFCLAKAQTRFP
jgi:hypothetical protein